jgi:hypothetical protein
MHSLSMDHAGRYSRYQDTLLALITYLGLAGWRSRSPNGLSRDLGLDEQLITATLAEFPGLFRKGSTYRTAVGSQHSYTLHARYALRRPRSQAGTTPTSSDEREHSPSDPTTNQDGRGEELDTETIRALLDFVSDQARAEREARHQRTSQSWVAIGVAVAAAASVTAALIQALTG